MRIAINGFGRIGRNFLRVVAEDPQALKDLEIVAINIGPAVAASVAQLFTYDTLMGTFKGHVTLEDNCLVVNGKRITLVAETDPAKLPWKQHAIDWVVDATGHFTQREMAEKHIAAGARGVLITAPAHDEDVTIVLGVNDQLFDRHKHHIVSIGSCTTNAIVPMLDVLEKSFGITAATMTTIHAYTNDQVLLDVENRDPRRARAAALNIVPTSTGSSKLIEKLLPSLQGKVTATAIRVPVAKVSLIDVVFNTNKPISREAVNQVCQQASQGYLKGIMDVINLPLVSTDFYGNNHSVIIDSLLTQAHGSVGQLFGWYDNEWGYSERLKDFLIRCFQ